MLSFVFCIAKWVFSVYCVYALYTIAVHIALGRRRSGFVYSGGFKSSFLKYKLRHLQKRGEYLELEQLLDDRYKFVNLSKITNGLYLSYIDLYTWVKHEKTVYNP